MLRQKSRYRNQLLQFAQKGEEEIFREIYNAYWSDVYALCFRYLKSASEAEDLLQEVFLKVWLHRGELSEIRHPASWIFTLTRNALISKFRRMASQARARMRYLADVRQIPDSNFPTDTADHSRLLADALNRLPPRQQHVFRLSRQEGKTLEEISRDLGISKKTVSNLLSQASHRLQELLRSGDLATVLCWTLSSVALLCYSLPGN